VVQVHAAEADGGDGKRADGASLQEGLIEIFSSQDVLDTCPAVH
jgi:hypothetical protein